MHLELRKPKNGLAGQQLPSIILHPPEDEPESEPCAFHCHRDVVRGLSNPERSRPLSALNSTLQLLSALPFINEELPMESMHRSVNEFTRTIRAMHLAEDTQHLSVDWLRELSGLSSFSNDDFVDFSSFADAVVQLVLANCRFGLRLNLTLTDDKQTIEYSTNCLRLSLNRIPSNQKVDFVSLLNKSVGNNSTFFFGGRKPLAIDTDPLIPSVEFGTQIRFVSLPHYLFVLFERNLTLEGYHNVSVEMPTDLDLGRFLLSKESNQKTFYNLHGFVTQADGHYLTYTRNHESRQWFRCENEEIVTVDLEGCICSKGVMLVVYKLKDSGKRR